jgi:DNA/RNA-binding domain of Phe-tRNA-synthetase-like protein
LKKAKIKLRFSPVIQNKIPLFKLGILQGENLKVIKYSENVTRLFAELEEEVKEKFKNQPPSSNKIISAVRRMYRRIGWEPTQYRPSSEAMIRRFLKDKGLYRINNLVDMGNIASTRFHLPMGLYDRDQIKGIIQVDVGKEEETYQGISKNLIHATGKLVLRDDAGIFGNPTADSFRTSIQSSTKNVLALFFTPPEVKEEWLIRTLVFLEQLYKQECPQGIFFRDIVYSSKCHNE